MEAKELAYQADTEKGVPHLLGSNLTYLICLIQVSDHKDLPAVWEELPGYLKYQQLTTLQRDLGNMAWRLSIQAPIVATPGLLKITLVLSIRLEHQENLGSSLHQFGLIQHTYATRKVLKAWADQHQVITGGGAAPYLADASTLTATDRVSLTATLLMARGGNARMRVVLSTLFGPNHLTAMSTDELNM